MFALICVVWQLANSLSVTRRVVLTGTPIQNDLQELFALSDFCNPGVLGTHALGTYIQDVNNPFHGCIFSWLNIKSNQNAIILRVIKN